MLIQQDVVLKRKVNRRNGREYDHFFISFSTMYTPILSKYLELHDVLLLSSEKKIVIPRAKLYVYGYQLIRGQKIKQFSISVPKHIAEELWAKGERKLKVVVELPNPS